MSEQKPVRLIDEGLPFVELRESGVVIDTERNKVMRGHGPKQNTIAIWRDNKATQINRDFLVRKYFHNPLATMDVKDIRHLAFMGLSDYVVTSQGKLWSRKTWMFLKGRLDRKGYHRVYLTDDVGNQKYHRVHRLVALAFIPNFDNKPEVNHTDGDKTNNDVRNLEWATAEENHAHARKHGLRAQTLTDEQIHSICRLFEDGHGIREVSRILNVCEHAVTHIIRGSHSRISKSYNIKNRSKYSKRSSNK